jgi:uncharacterized protein YfaS (alpha-2-macroglobulin family)
VLLSAAAGGDGPSSHADRGVDEKRQLVREEKKAFFRDLLTAGVRLPMVLLVLLVLPLAGYALMRLVRRDFVAGDEAHMAELRSAGRSLSWRWCLGFYLPVLMAIGVGMVADRSNVSRPERLVLVTLVALTVIMFILLFTGSRRLRRCQAAAAVPTLRKVVGCVPWAYLAAVACVVTAVLAASARLISEYQALRQAALMLAVAASVVGFLAVGRVCAVRGVSKKRWLWLVLSRPAVFALPVVVAMFFMVRGMGAAGLAGPVPPMAEMMDVELGAVLEEAELRMAMAPQQELARERAAGVEGGKTLKAPTRVRRFFPETLLWQPELITDESGRAQLELTLADSITTWRVAASAVSRSGLLGSTSRGLVVFQDFFVDIDFPVALTQNDEVSVPVAVFNYLDRPQTVRLEASAGDWCELLGSGSVELRIGAKEVTGVHFPIRALKPGRHAFTVKAYGSEMADAVERQVTVRPDGQAVVETVNGRLGENLLQEILIPDGAIDGASDLYVKIYPGAFSQVVEGLDSIFQMPFGCFEQTSSTTYPNVLVLDYLRRTKQAKPELEMKALNFINLGYQRLLSFEVQGGGFEWFGRPPAHNILTAYGLMEFQDMAEVYEIDPQVIDRTRQWLYAQQQGDGTWEPTTGGIAEGAIDKFRGAVFRSTAYVAWALASSGDRDSRLDRALDHIQSGWQEGASGDDPYTLALCANALVAAGRSSDARPILDRLESMKLADGETVHWSSTSEGVTYTRGSALDIETTAVVAQAMLGANRHAGTAHKALAWLISNKDPRGTWHSTQATIQAMRAMLAGTGAGGGVEETVHVTVTANGEVASELEITPETSDVYRLIDLRPMVKEGVNTVALESAGRANLAFQIVATHYLPWGGAGDGSEAKALEIDVTYDRTRVSTDDLLSCDVSIRYNRAGVAKMTIVDLGLPPGFEVQTDAFQRLKDGGVIQRYTLTGRQVILYFDEIRSGSPIEFSYQLRAKFPVRAKTPPSRAYQYYEPEVEDEAAPVELVVT